MINYGIGSESREEKLNSDQKLERNLQRVLHRIGCPSEQDLGEFQLGMLDPSITQQISQHLPTCPHCRQELAQLDDFLAATAPNHHPQPVLPPSKLQIVLAKLVEGFSLPQPDTGLAFRNSVSKLDGDSEQIEYRYEADEIEINISIEASQEHLQKWDIMGDIDSGEGEERQWHLEMWRTDSTPPERIRVMEIDPLEMSVDGLVAGQYTLIFSNDSAREIHISDLQIG